MFTRKFETQLLYDELHKRAVANDHSVITYEELNKLVGGDVQREYYSYLWTAKEAAQKDTGRLFGTVKKLGVKLLTPAEQASEPDAAIRDIRKKTKRRLDRLSRVQYSELPDAAKQRHNVAASVIGALHLMTSASKIKKLEAKVQERREKLDFGDTIKLFE